MNVEIFIHGVPNGEDYYGGNADRSYAGTFYTNCDDEVKFLVELRSLNNAVYSYYNYLVYKNVIGADGRSGSYFGISVRCNSFYKDAINMYRILDSAFNFYAIGTILSLENNKLKYKNSSFSNITQNLKQISDYIVMVMNQSLTVDNIITLSNIPQKVANYPTVNLYDCTADVALNSIKQYGRFSASPYYASIKESTLRQTTEQQILAVQQQCDNRFNAEKKSHEDREANLNKKLSKSQEAVTSLNKELQDKETQNSQLKTRIQQLENKLNKIDKLDNINRLLAPIRTPIVNLSDAIQELLPEKSSKSDENNKKHKLKNAVSWSSYIPLVNLFILLIIFAFMFIIYSSDNQFEEASSSNKNMNKANKSNVQYSDSTAISGDTSEYTNPFSPSSTESTKKTTEPAYRVRISVDEWDSSLGPLKINKEYTITAIDGREEGSWKVSGCTLTKTKNPDKIKIIPNEEQITIDYYVGNILYKTRTLNAK